MAEYTGTFETGVNGNAVLISDAGSATPWNAVSDPANVTVTYSDVQKYQTLSCLITNDATGGIGHVEWDNNTISPSFSGTHYGRIYVYYSGAIPGSSHFLVRALDTGGARSWEIIVLNTGIIIMRDAGGTTRVTFTTAVGAASWFRFEWRVVQSTTAGELEGKLFLSADSGSPTETQTSSGAFSTLADTAFFRFGAPALAVPNLVVHIDNILANDTGYPGPAIESPHWRSQYLDYDYSRT